MSNTKLVRGRFGNKFGEIADIRIDPATHTLGSIEYEHTDKS